MMLKMVLPLMVVAVSAYVINPTSPDIQRYEIDTNNMPNSYNFYYETKDGSSRKEEGVILDQGTKDAALDVLGTVRWYDEKGHLYQMTYKAGKRGYRTSIKKIS